MLVLCSEVVRTFWEKIGTLESEIRVSHIVQFIIQIEGDYELLRILLIFNESG